MYLIVGQTRCVLVRGDITAQKVDAIVNAANSGLQGGGGVDGAIHRAGGPSILEECREIRSRQGPVSTGHAVATTAGRLSARMVIHAVGPVWRGGKHGEDEDLHNAYRNSLHLACERGATSVAFPGISTGIYGYPREDASRIALETVMAFVREHPRIREVRFVAYTQQDYDAFVPLFTASGANTHAGERPA